MSPLAITLDDILTSCPGTSSSLLSVLGLLLPVLSSPFLSFSVSSLMLIWASCVGISRSSSLACLVGAAFVPGLAELDAAGGLKNKTGTIPDLHSPEILSPSGELPPRHIRKLRPRSPSWRLSTLVNLSSSDGEEVSGADRDARLA
jgi:hypothetical protein